MGWLIALGVLVLIAITPVGASVIYDSNGLVLRLLLGLIRIKLFPQQKKNKPKETKKEEPAKVKPAAKPKESKKEEKDGGSLLDFLPIVNHVLEFLGKFRTKLRINRLEMKLTMASDDPCDLAINYGRAWAALGNLMPQLERFFVIRKRDLQVQCDFTALETEISRYLEREKTAQMMDISLGYVVYMDDQETYAMIGRGHLHGGIRRA